MKRILLLALTFLAVSSAFGQDTLTGLQAAWKMNEGTGTTAADSSASANNLTVTGATWSGAISPLTNALTYTTGTTHSISANNTNVNFDVGQPFSISTWAKPSGTAGTIVGHLDTASSFKGWELSTQLASGNYQFILFLPSVYPSNALVVATSATNTFAVNILHHVVVTYDGSHLATGVKFYVDGVLQTNATAANNTLTTSTTNTTPVWFGSRIDATNKLATSIGATYIYSRVLAQADVTALFTSPYTLAASATVSPLFSPTAGGYAGTQTVTISDASPSPTITYCIDSTNTCTPNLTYSTPLSVTLGQFVRAFANSSGLAQSATVSSLYRTSTPTAYFVATGGSDTANGTTTGTPWATATQASNWNYLPGDSLSFNGGNTFTGPLSNSTMQGSQALPIVISSYGTGKATINGGSGSGITLTSGNLLCSNTGGGIILTNPDYVTVNNLNVSGSGWTGTPPSITVLNYGCGIQLATTKLSGTPLRNLAVTNSTITGFAVGLNVYASSSSGLTGVSGLNISNNTISSNELYGILALGFGNAANGAATMIKNVYIGHNTLTNYPGNPNGGSNGAPAAGTQAINLGEMTGLTVEWNYVNEGGFITGTNLGGGTCSIVSSNSTNVIIQHNEVTGTTNYGIHDGCAIDLDQANNNSEVAYNWTYNNVGPSIQLGSFGGSIFVNNSRIHHNISYNDVRGITGQEEGVFRIWGSSTNTWIFNNSVYIGAGTTGTPSAVSWETGANTGVTIAGNLFKTTGGIGFYHGNTTTNPSHIGTPVTLGNLYDATGGSLVISNDTGAATVNVTSLATWQADGFETMNGMTYGSTGAANLPNLAGFTVPSGGFLANGLLTTMPYFNLGPTSAAIGIGIDPEMAGTFLGFADFHGSPARSGSAVDIGAVSNAQYSTGNGPGAIVIQ